MVIYMDNKFIELNSKNLLFNYNFFKNQTQKKVIAVVKDNAYGHGLKQVIQVLDQHDIEAYAVANLKEATEAIKYTKKDILILDKVTDFKKITEQMILTVTSLNHLQEMIDSKVKIRIHIKINTGMNRKGIFPAELQESLMIINNHPSLKLEGVYTHYASNKRRNLLKQFETFKETTKSLNKSKYLIHASSSVSSLSLKENHTHACRIGIGLYGLNHRFEVLNKTKPVLSLYTIVSDCAYSEKNNKVGYNYMYKTPSSGYIILSPIGYGLGYMIRRNYLAFYKGQYIKQISRTCMDCCLFFSTKPIEIGSKIELFGEHVKVDNIAKSNKCSPYEIVTLLNKDIKRIVI